MLKINNPIDVHNVIMPNDTNLYDNLFSVNNTVNVKVFACAASGGKKYYAGTYDGIYCTINEIADRVFVDFGVRVLTLGDIPNAPDGAYLYVEIDGLKKNAYPSMASCATSGFNLPASYTNISIAPYDVNGDTCFIINKTGIAKTAFAVSKSEIIDRSRINASISYVKVAD